MSLKHRVGSFEHFWELSFDGKPTVSFDDFIEGLALYMNDDLELPLYTTVDVHAKAVKAKLENARRPLSAEVEQGCSIHDVPMFVNAAIFLWLGWFDDEAHKSVEDTRSISQPEFKSFVEYFGGDLITAFINAQISMFDENGALYPWIHSHTSENATRQTGFRVRFTAAEIDYLIAEEFENGELKRQFRVIFEQSTVPGGHVSDWYCILRGDSSHVPTDEKVRSLKAFIETEFPNSNPLPLPSALVPLTESTSGKKEWLTRALFHSIQANDYLAVELAMKANDLSQIRDAYGLTCLHVACAFNRVRILDIFKSGGHVPVEALVATSSKAIDSVDAPSLAQFTVGNRAMPYFRVNIRLKSGLPCGAVACSYQSQGCLAMITSWLAEQHITVQHTEA